MPCGCHCGCGCDSASRRGAGRRPPSRPPSLLMGARRGSECAREPGRRRHYSRQNCLIVSRIVLTLATRAGSGMRHDELTHQEDARCVSHPSRPLSLPLCLSVSLSLVSTVRRDFEPPRRQHCLPAANIVCRPRLRWSNNDSIAACGHLSPQTAPRSPLSARCKAITPLPFSEIVWRA